MIYFGHIVAPQRELDLCVGISVGSGWGTGGRCGGGQSWSLILEVEAVREDPQGLWRPMKS